MAQTFGASGTLIGAALENVGFHYQSYILDQLTSPLTSSIAQLLYVFGAVIAMATFAVSGRYKMGFWFLIGPGLYLASIVPRTETEGVEWKFGTQKRNSEMLNAEVTGTLEKHPDAAKPARVSALFAEYDRTISRVTQEIVRVISSGRITSDVTFIMKAELNGFMKSQEVDDPGFRDLVQHGFMRGCNDVIEAGREMRNPQNSQSEREDWKSKYEGRMKYTQVSLTDQAISYLAAFRVTNPDLANQDLVGWQGLVDRAGPGGAQAVQLPQDGANAQKVTEWLRQVDSTEVNTADADFQQKVEQEKQKIQRENPYTCSQIWNMVYGGLLRYGKMAVERAKGYAGANGISEEQIASDLAKATGVNTQDVKTQSERLDILYKTAAQYTLRTEMLKSSPSAFIADYAQKTKALSQFIVPGYSDLAYVEQRRIANSVWEEKSAFVNAATSLPYYQGVVLYFLALLFPFFALLLLIPGKHVGFLFWFMLWMWAKSWDIGFAVCMLIDDLLFQLFSGGGQEMHCGLHAANCNDFSVAIRALREVDPTFQIATYYNIMGMALSAIPTVSSYLIIGSLKGGAGLVASGMDTFSKPYETGERGMFEQTEGNTRYRKALDNVKEANENALSNILDGRSPYTNPPTGVDGLPGPGEEPVHGVSRQEGRDMYGETVTDGVLRAAMNASKFVSGLGAGWKDAEKHTGDPIAGRVRDIRKADGPWSRNVAAARANFFSAVKQAGKHATENRRLGMKRDITNVGYDTMNSQENQAIGAETVADGRMQLPMLQPNGWSEELDYELMRLKQGLEMGVEGYDTMINQMPDNAGGRALGAAEALAGPTLFYAAQGGESAGAATPLGSGTGLSGGVTSSPFSIDAGAPPSAASAPSGAAAKPSAGSPEAEKEGNKPKPVPITNSGAPMAPSGSLFERGPVSSVIEWGSSLLKHISPNEAGAATLDEYQAQRTPAPFATAESEKPEAKATPETDQKKVARKRITREELEMADPMELTLEEQDLLRQMQAEEKGQAIFPGMSLASGSHSSSGGAFSRGGSSSSTAGNLAPIEPGNEGAQSSAPTSSGSGESSLVVAGNQIESAETARQVGNAVQQGVAQLDGTSVGTTEAAANSSLGQQTESGPAFSFSQFVTHTLTTDPASVPALGITASELPSPPEAANASIGSMGNVIASTAGPSEGSGAVSMQGVWAEPVTATGEGENGTSVAFSGGFGSSTSSPPIVGSFSPVEASVAEVTSGIQFGSTWSLGESNGSSVELSKMITPEAEVVAISQEAWKPTSEDAAEFFGAPTVSSAPVLTALSGAIEVSETMSSTPQRAPAIHTAPTRASAES